MTTPTGSIGPADPSLDSAPAAPASRSAVDAALVESATPPPACAW